jgi:hypothetical protein
MFPLILFAPVFKWGDIRFPLSGEVEQQWSTALASATGIPEPEVRRQIGLALKLRAESLQNAGGESAAHLSLARSSVLQEDANLDEGTRQKDVSHTQRLISLLG